MTLAMYQRASQRRKILEQAQVNNGNEEKRA